MASLEVMVLPVETQGLQVIVLGHMEITAMKIKNNSCGKPKRKCIKAASLSLTSPVTVGHCKRWQVTVWCHVAYVLPFDPVNKSELYLCFLFTCLSKITLTSTWKEVKKIIKEDPRCIKFSSSDRVRGFCLRLSTVFININWVLNPVPLVSWPKWNWWF